MESSNSNLVFVSTQTVSQFKADVNAEKLEVLPQYMRDAAGKPLKGSDGKTIFYKKEDNKLFFTAGGIVGKVSKKGIPLHPMVSLVEDNNGDQFYLLHEAGEGGAPVLATF